MVCECVKQCYSFDHCTLWHWLKISYIVFNPAFCFRQSRENAARHFSRLFLFHRFKLWQYYIMAISRWVYMVTVGLHTYVYVGHMASSLKSRVVTHPGDTDDAGRCLTAANGDHSIPQRGCFVTIRGGTRIDDELFINRTNYILLRDKTKNSYETLYALIARPLTSRCFSPLIFQK